MEVQIWTGLTATDYQDSTMAVSRLAPDELMISGQSPADRISNTNPVPAPGF